MPSIRALTTADLPALARRLAAEYPRDGCNLENLRRKTFGDPDYERDLNLVALDGERLVGGLIGTRRGGRAFVKVLSIHPDRATAAALLAAFETRAAGLGCANLNVSGSAPNYLLPGVEATDELSLRFWQEQGYEPVRESRNMSCDLTRVDLDTSAAEQQLSQAGYRLRRLAPGDEPALTDFMLAHFSAGWLTETLAALDHDLVTCQLVWHSGQVVAFAAAEVTNPGWFGPMGTAPAHRRSGLGRVTLRRALADLRDLGYRTAEIGWVGPVGFYARHCQATISREFRMLQKELA